MMYVEVHRLSQGKALVWLNCELNYVFYGTTFLFEKNDTLNYSDLGLSTHFLKDKWSKPVTSRKAAEEIFANDKIQAFKGKLKIWKTCVYHHKPDSFWQSLGA